MRVYAKTGTSSESKDLWMVAGTPYYVGSVWYGFDQPENVRNASAAAKVWRDIMKKIHVDLEVKEFEYSEDVVSLRYCNATGKLAGSTCESTARGYFTADTKPKYCNGVHPVQQSTDTSTEETPSENTSSTVTSSEGDTSGESPPQEDESPPSDSTETSSDVSSTESSESSEGSTEQENPSESDDSSSEAPFVPI